MKDYGARVRNMVCGICHGPKSPFHQAGMATLRICVKCDMSEVTIHGAYGPVVRVFGPPVMMRYLREGMG